MEFSLGSADVVTVGQQQTSELDMFSQMTSRQGQGVEAGIWDPQGCQELRR